MNYVYLYWKQCIVNWIFLLAVILQGGRNVYAKRYIYKILNENSVTFSNAHSWIKNYQKLWLTFGQPSSFVKNHVIFCSKTQLPTKEIVCACFSLSTGILVRRSLIRKNKTNLFSTLILFDCFISNLFPFTTAG